MAKFNVYVLLSKKNGKMYIGMTSKDPKERLKEHNLGSNQYTKRNLPYELLYFEMDYCKECSLKRERFLKSGQGRILLGKLLRNKDL